LLDVGPGYIPGEPIDVAHSVQMAFNLSAISATDGNAFHMSVIADSDSSDLLPALGLNTLFTGSDATDIEVRAALENDPDLLATSSSGTTSDAGAVLALIATTQSGAAGLDDRSFSESFAEMVGSLGSEIDSTRNAHESESLVHESLVARQAQVSGVNTDEELAKMITAQQAYSAAGQFIRVISDLNAVLMSLI
jgi:flagellar hook-associated protein 1 FlgK